MTWPSELQGSGQRKARNFEEGDGCNRFPEFGMKKIELKSEFRLP